MAPDQHHGTVTTLLHDLREGRKGAADELMAIRCHGHFIPEHDLTTKRYFVGARSFNNNVVIARHFRVSVTALDLAGHLITRLTLKFRVVDMNKRAAGFDANEVVSDLIFVKFNQMFADELLLSHCSLSGASAQGGQADGNE